MRISLIHPSRSRPAKSGQTTRNWLAKAGTDNVELLVSLDSSDPELAGYNQLYQTGYIIGNNSSVVEATNNAAALATGDILIYLSDDFDCPDNWGPKIIEAVKNEGPVWLLKVDDCLQKFDVPVLTIPIMSRGLYEKMGYFWHPAYKSMFVDCDLYEVAKRMNVMRFAPNLKFPHNHVSIGKAQDDETYRRSAANWNQGQELFNSRKARNFDL